MWFTSLIIFLVIVGFSGWLAGKLVYGKGLGLIRNVGIGLLGAILSFLVLGLFRIQVESFLGMLLASSVGAATILAFIKTVRHRSTRVRIVKLQKGIGTD